MTILTKDVMTEAELQRTVVEAAHLFGWITYHTHDSRRSEPGFPDLVLAHPLRGVKFLECKREKGKLSAGQVQWLETLAAGGADALVVRPSNLDDIIAQLGR